MPLAHNIPSSPRPIPQSHLSNITLTFIDLSHHPPTYTSPPLHLSDEFFADAWSPYWLTTHHAPPPYLLSPCPSSHHLLSTSPLPLSLLTPPPHLTSLLAPTSSPLTSLPLQHNSHSISRSLPSPTHSHLSSSPSPLRDEFFADAWSPHQFTVPLKLSQQLVRLCLQMVKLAPQLPCNAELSWSHSSLILCHCRTP